MYLRSLYLNNFRIFSNALFEFDPKINLIYGSNAQGKTTILEALFFLITGRSFRTNKAADLIRRGESSFFIDASFVKCGVEQRLRIWCDGKDRKITYNNTPYTSSTNLIGLLQGVVVTPEEVQLVKGAPHFRRQFLDLQIAQVDPLYVHYFTRFQKAMQQRNYLLRSKSIKTIESWEHEMAKSAAYITLSRGQVIKDLQNLIQRHHFALITYQKDLNITYKPNISAIDTTQLSSQYLEILKKNRPREMILGVTTHGPHKDDLDIRIGDLEARNFASEGEQRSCVTSLYFSVWERMSTFLNEAPLLLLDDFGMSLDEGRKSNLVNHLDQFGQVFITTTHHLELKGKRIEIIQ